MPELEPYKGDYYLWQYVPSIGASVLFLILFVAATAFHFWKVWKTKSRFCIAFCVGGLFESIGYIARAACYRNTAGLIPYCIQNVFILLGPALFAASIYMALGRLMRTVGAERYSLIPINRLTKTFVASDVLSFLIQGTGSGMMAMGGSMASMAKGITIGGLAIQVIMFGFFIATSYVFEKRMTRSPTAEGTTWKASLHLLYLISGFIMIRSIFRLVEFGQGQEGYFMSHEWTMYVFDSIFMIAVMAAWAKRHPGDADGSLSGDQTADVDDFQEK